MIDEKKLANAAMNDDELDQVAGGNRRETGDDGHELFKRGLIHNGYTADEIREVIHKMGYYGYQGINKAVGNNVYHDQNGNTYTVNATGETLDQAGMMSFLREKYPNVRFKGISEPQSLNELVGMIK